MTPAPNNLSIRFITHSSNTIYTILPANITLNMFFNNSMTLISIAPRMTITLNFTVVSGGMTITSTITPATITWNITAGYLMVCPPLT